MYVLVSILLQPEVYVNVLVLTLQHSMVWANVLLSSLQHPMVCVSCFPPGSSSHHQGQVLLEDLEPKKRSKKHKHSHKKRKLDQDKDNHGVSLGIWEEI